MAKPAACIGRHGSARARLRLGDGESRRRVSEVEVYACMTYVMTLAGMLSGVTMALAAIFVASTSSCYDNVKPVKAWR